MFSASLVEMSLVAGITLTILSEWQKKGEGVGADLEITAEDRVLASSVLPARCDLLIK